MKALVNHLCKANRRRPRWVRLPFLKDSASEHVPGQRSCPAASIVVQLTKRVGLSHRVDIRVDSALDPQFADASFDWAWSRNVAMNIADRPLYYDEIHRALRRGGRLAIQDLAKGNGGALQFPVM